MSDAEKDALRFLNQCADDPGNIATGVHYQTIRRMLAEPRLPAEPSEELLRVIRVECEGEMAPAYTAMAIYRALYTHLTKPATKTVEVWRVEYATASGPHCLTFTTEEDARRQAESMRGGIAQCIHVTGPHKQTVPAT